MQLSPLARHSVIARQRAADEKAKTPNVNKAEIVMMYRCPVCGELYDDDFDAEACCPPPSEDGLHHSICPVCGDKCGTARNAADCCLWKDFDPMTRWQMADAVEAGSDWTTELGLRTN